MIMASFSEIQWRYRDDASGLYDDYDEEVSEVIENAYQEKEPSVDLEMEDGNIRIDFENMVEIDMTGERPNIPVERMDLQMGGIDQPKANNENKGYDKEEEEADEDDNEEVKEDEENGDEHKDDDEDEEDPEFSEAPENFEEDQFGETGHESNGESVLVDEQNAHGNATPQGEEASEHAHARKGHVSKIAARFSDSDTAHRYESNKDGSYIDPSTQGTEKEQYRNNNRGRSRGRARGPRGGGRGRGGDRGRGGRGDYQGRRGNSAQSQPARPRPKPRARKNLPGGPAGKQGQGTLNVDAYHSGSGSPYGTPRSGSPYSHRRDDPRPQDRSPGHGYEGEYYNEGDVFSDESFEESYEHHSPEYDSYSRHGGQMYQRKRHHHESEEYGYTEGHYEEEGGMDYEGSDYRSQQYHGHPSLHGGGGRPIGRGDYSNRGSRGHPNARRGRPPTPSHYSPATPRRPESHKSFSPNQNREPPELEVSGFDQSMDEEVLSMYFESPRKSGGGELEEFQMSPSGQVATIKFADANVTEKVLQRTHKLGGFNLVVEEKKQTVASAEGGGPETSEVIEVAGFDSSMSEDMLTLYFENERKSGGGDITSFKFNRTHTSATITFADTSVTARVLEKTHKVLGQALTVVEKKEESGDSQRPDEDHTDSPGSVLEVSGFKSSTSEEMLMMYFENTRRSGGSEIKDMEMNRKNNKATITFVDQGAIGRVVKKMHRLDGVRLDVRERKAQAPRPIDKHRLFLRGIPEDVTLETLHLYLENRTGIDESPDIVYGEQPGTAMLFYDEEIEDLDSVVVNFGKRKLKKSVVSAEKVKATDGILVQGFKANASTDMIELYFENERKSGGGPVSEFTLNEEENIAFVSFEDWQIVNRVTARTHNLSGQRLTVTAHYECMGTVVSTEGPVPVVPKPIQHPVRPELMKHVMDKQFTELAAEMKKAYAVALWPCNGDRSHVLIKPSDGGDEDRSVWKQWKSNATSKFTAFLEKIREENIQVPSNIWTDVTEALAELTLGNVDVEEKGNKSTITLRGMVSDVSNAKTLISQSINELKEKADRAAQTVEKTVKLAPLKIKMFKMFGIENELHGKFPEVQTSIQSDRNEIVFKGVRGEVSETVVAMYQVYEALGSCVFKGDPSVVVFVSQFCDVVNGVIASQNVEAICDVEDGKVSVYGKSSSATEKALSILRKDLISKSMPIRNDSTMNVLQSKKGNNEINKLNDSGEVIIRLESSNRNIIVTGLTQKVEDAIVEIGQFLDKNVIIEKVIPFPPSHVKFILQRCGKELADMRSQFPDTNMLPVVTGKKTGMKVKANENGIAGVTHLLEALKSKLADRKYTVDKAGIPELLTAQRGKTFLQSVATDCDCHISAEDEDEVDESDIETSVDAGGVSGTLCHVTTRTGYRLAVCHGDMTKERVDAIVNAANTRLAHVGGLARAIADAGGPAIQKESNAVIKKLGRHLNTSEAVCTGAGKLPCRYVIHVSGPTWSKVRRDDPDHSLEKDLLYDAVTNTLREAHARNVTSIAIPAISTGVYGFPIKPCAEIVVEAAVDFMTGTKTSLKEIRFTSIIKEQCMEFQSTLTGKFGSDLVVGTATPKKSDKPREAPHPRPARSARPATPATNLTMFTKKTADTLTTNEGKDVTLKKGSLAGESADVIVNTTAGEMDLTRGNVSKALLAAAGPTLQQLCDAQVTQSDGSRRDVVAGDFIETGPGNLKCKKVFHSHCPGYKDTDSTKVLQLMIKKMLDKANQSGMVSIAIPAIGTGNLGFPRDVTARAMYEAVAEFSKNNPSSALKDIRFWVYDKDQPTIQAFEAEMQQRSVVTAMPKSASDTSLPDSGKKKKKRRMKKSASASAMPFAESHEEEDPSFDETYFAGAPADVRSAGGSLPEVTFGPITVKVHQGDLAQENTDAIVNTVGKELALKGVVSRALIRVGGKVISDECENIKKASKTVPEVAKTTAGKLPSKYIIHAYICGPDKVKKITQEILRLAEKEGMKSVAFPALGTGNIGGSPNQVAPAIIDAIGDFATNERPKNLQLVKLVIFQQDMVPVFEDTLMTKAGIPVKKPEGAFKRGMNYIGSYFKYGSGSDKRIDKGRREKERSSDDPNTLILYIVAKDTRNLDRAVKLIDDYIKDEFYSEEVKLETVEGEDTAITDSMMRSIRAIGSKHKVMISLATGKKAIVVQGVRASVLGTKADVILEFSRIQADEKRKTEDLLLSKEIQWRYQAETGIYDDYDEEINAVIEKAHKKKKTFVEIDLEDGKIRIDFVKMAEIDTTGKHPDRSINRVDLNTESRNTGSVLPTNWIPMKATENLTVVQLTQGTPEYTKMEQTFKNGYNANIMKIERIQNKEIFTQYTARKEQMKARLGRDTEGVFFHGTSQDTIQKINLRGFNRSYCGKNATVLGRGTYFAKNTSYSAQSTYSPPDGQGNKHIYICKVLVGDCERGNSSMVMPSQKPNSVDIYDSTGDSAQNPSIVVIYHDAQAYPEYLVTFR